MVEKQFHQGFHLKNLIEKQRFKISEVSEKSGIARSSLYDIFKKAEILRSDLEKICKAIGVDIKQFYPGLASNVLNEDEPEYRRLTEQVRSLEDQLRAKETIILQQSEMIEMLKSQRDRLKNRKK